jgi:flavorubredoxin
MTEEKVIDEKHGVVIQEEINAFRELFKQWVATFQKDETEDEWGLFI